MFEDDGTTRDRELSAHVERAGPSPPDDDGLRAAASSLLEATEPVDGVRLVRLSFGTGTGRETARKLLASVDEQLTVVGSTLPDEYDPASPELDVLVETDYGIDTIASGLADVSVVEGVVVADVAVPGDDEAADSVPDEVSRDALSIYRLDDHLVVTDDFGQLVERFQAALGDDDAMVTAREAQSDVGRLEHELSTVADRVDALEASAEVLDAEVERVASDLEATVETVDAELEGLGERVEALATDVDAAADQSELESLWYHVESEVPSREEVGSVFAPAAERIDGDGQHGDMGSVVAEIDRELRRTHALREAGFVERLRWLLTGDLPADDGDADGG